MSYVSLLKTIPGLLSQPTGIAAIASVGIHGAIAFILPLVPLDSNSAKEGKTPKTVGLVELNQADQQRLPQTNPSANITTLPPLPAQGTGALPNFANQNTPLRTPSTASVPPTGLFLPPLNQSPQDLGVKRLPSRGGSTSAQKRQFFQRNNYSFNPNSGVIFNAPTRAVRGRKGRSGSNSRIAGGQQFGRGRRGSLSNSLPLLQAGRRPSGLPNTPAPINPNSTEISRLPQGVAPPPEVSNSQTSNSQVIGQERQLIAPIGKNPQVGSNFTLAKGSQFSGESLNPSRWSGLKQGNTNRGSGQRVLSEGELFAEAKKTFPQVQTQLKTISVKLNAPGESKKTNVRGALVVDGNGRIDFFRLLDNSIPSGLKMAVRDHFRQHFRKNPIKANGKPKYYSFNVAFEPGANNSVVIPKTNGNSANSVTGSKLTDRLRSIRNSRTPITKPSTGKAPTNQPSSQPSQQGSNSQPQKLPKLNVVRQKPKVPVIPIEVKKPSGQPASKVSIPVKVPVAKPTPARVEKKPVSKPIIIQSKPNPQQNTKKSESRPSRNSVNVKKPSSSRKATLTQRLRNASENNGKKSNTALIKKLRQIKRERSQSN